MSLPPTARLGFVLSENALLTDRRKTPEYQFLHVGDAPRCQPPATAHPSADRHGSGTSAPDPKSTGTACDEENALNHVKDRITTLEYLCRDGALSTR